MDRSVKKSQPLAYVAWKKGGSYSGVPVERVTRVIIEAGAQYVGLNLPKPWREIAKKRRKRKRGEGAACVRPLRTKNFPFAPLAPSKPTTPSPFLSFFSIKIKRRFFLLSIFGEEWGAIFIHPCPHPKKEEREKNCNFRVYRIRKKRLLEVWFRI